MKKDIILIGGGGHCKSCIDVIEAGSEFKVAGIIDKKEKAAQKVLGYDIIACDEDLPELVKKYKYYLITIGQIKSAAKRIEKFEFIRGLGGKFPTIISPLAYVSKSASVGKGTIIMHNAIINTEVCIGENCIINTAAIIEHESQIMDHCHISTSAVINGGNSIGEATFVGSKSVTAQGIRIESNTIIGAGSFVRESLEKSGTYIGSPAKKVE